MKNQKLKRINQNEKHVKHSVVIAKNNKVKINKSKGDNVEWNQALLHAAKNS